MLFAILRIRRSDNRKMAPEIPRIEQAGAKSLVLARGKTNVLPRQTDYVAFSLDAPFC